MSAIFTLLYDANYIPGALLLGSVLRDMISEDITLGVLIDKLSFSEFQLNLLSGIYHQLVDIPVITSGFTDKLAKDLKRPELDKTFSKIHLWNLDYEKVLYLDCDTLPNPDSNLLDLLSLDVDKGKIYASPDSGFPDIFNSGMFVIGPNDQDYGNLVLLVTGGDDVTFDGADQGLLNQYFNSDPDWVGGKTPSNWVKLPFLYNVTPNTQYQYGPAFNHFSKDDPDSTPTSASQGPGGPAEPDQASAYAYTATSFYGSQIKLIHYIGPVKPWSTYNPGTAEWWRLWHKYFDHDTFSVQDRFATADTVWNPAVSGPPKSATSSTSTPTKSSRSKPQIKSILKKKLAKFGFHPEQVPERVFYSPRTSTRSSPQGSPNSVSNVSNKLDNLNI